MTTDRWVLLVIGCCMGVIFLPLILMVIVTGFANVLNIALLSWGYFFDSVGLVKLAGLAKSASNVIKEFC